MSDGSATSGMEDQEWKLWHGNEGLGSGMENEGTGMEAMQSDELPASRSHYLYIESRCHLLLIIIESILHSFRLLTDISSKDSNIPSRAK